MIVKDIQKGLLTKMNGKWYVDYISESAGDNNWHNCIPIYGLNEHNEVISDLTLVQKFNKPVIELEGLLVSWTYKLTLGICDFTYAVLV